MTDETLRWLLEHDPEAQGVSLEEYRRRTGIETLGSETADIRRRRPIWEGEAKAHCRACAAKANVLFHTVG